MQTTAFGGAPVFGGFGDLGSFAEGYDNYGGYGSTKADFDHWQRKCDAATAKYEAQVEVRKKKGKKVDNWKTKLRRNAMTRDCARAASLKDSPSAQKAREDQAAVDALLGAGTDPLAALVGGGGGGGAPQELPPQASQGSLVVPIALALGAGVLIIGGAVAYTKLRKK